MAYSFYAAYYSYMSRLAIIFALVLVPLSADAAAINKISFTTTPQSIVPSAVSARITVETQDATGVPVSGNRVCLRVTSSSATAEFSTNETTWGTPMQTLALTQSANQFRRNLYYRDASSGTFTLTAKAGLAPGSTCTLWSAESATWSATQTITIGSESTSNTASAEQSQTTATTTTTATAAHTTTTSASGTFAPAVKPVKAAITSKSAATVLPPSPEAANESPAPLVATATQVAAAGSVSDGDYLWWLALFALTILACGAAFAARYFQKREWNIIDES
jgi:hypothetical protein